MDKHEHVFTANEYVQSRLIPLQSPNPSQPQKPWNNYTSCEDPTRVAVARATSHSTTAQHPCPLKYTSFQTFTGPEARTRWNDELNSLHKKLKKYEGAKKLTTPTSAN